MTYRGGFLTSMIRLGWLLLVFLLLDISAGAQEKYTISGYVKDASTGEDLIGANVYIKELLKGTTTNPYGFYSLTVEEGEYTLVVSFIGMQEYRQDIKLDEDKRVNVSLKASAVAKEEVVITGERSDKNTESTDMGTMEMEINTIKELPALMGEVDVLKTIQLLPGVQSGGEGSTGFYVRGGGPDQNLILLDEAVVYNAAHLFGFFSVFNADAIKNVELIKGGMPANYGGRLASVLDISMKEGNSKKFQAEGGIGLISSRLTLQGPIKKDTASFIISGRRTYADVLARPFINDSAEFAGSAYYFYDLNTKINYRISDKDRLFLSGYFGRDVFSFNSTDSDFSAKMPWGNATTSLRWNHLFNDKLFLNSTLIFSDYQFEFQAGQQEFDLSLFSGIRDWNTKLDFNYFPNVRHDIKFGLDYIYHTFTPSNVSARSGDVEFDLGETVRLYAHEAAMYVLDDFDITERIKVNAGLRATYFEQIGPFDRYVKNEFNQIEDTIHYGGVVDENPISKLLLDGRHNESVQVYRNIEPRLSTRFKVDKRSSIKAAFTQNYQYVHMASISSNSLPTDIWFPSTSIVRPQKSTQYAIGYFRNFLNDMLETSVELYYKDMRNLIEYKEGAVPGDNVADNADNNFTFGKGTSYGAEFFIKKRLGKLTGWVGYTLSKTDRVFEALNYGNPFPAKYDRRHDLSVVASYKLNEKWNFSSVFVYATGNAITLPVSRYIINGDMVVEYGDRNSYRMDPYHRLDISATYSANRSDKFESSWNFSIYNLYNRMNPYFIFFDDEGSLEDGSFRVVAKQVSLFPILPSVTWNFKF